MNASTAELETARDAGAVAYRKGLYRVPGIDQTVLDLIGAVPVGEARTVEIMQAFCDGFDAESERIPEIIVMVMDGTEPVFDDGPETFTEDTLILACPVCDDLNHYLLVQRATRHATLEVDGDWLTSVPEGQSAPSWETEEILCRQCSSTVTLVETDETRILL